MRDLLSGALREPRVITGGALMRAVLAVRVRGPWRAPHDPGDPDLLRTLLPPVWQVGGDPAFPLGTDSLGRCILSRLIYGARVAMTVAVVAALGAAVLGSALALVAGYFGRLIDWLIRLAVHGWMSFPPGVLALILMAGFRTGSPQCILTTVSHAWRPFLS